MSRRDGYAPAPRLTPGLLAAGLAAAGLLGACSRLGPSARYYYPAEDLLDGLVYAYAVDAAATAELEPHYWYFRGVATPDSLVLASTYYDAGYEPRQYVGERIVPSGSLQRDLRLFEPGPLGQPSRETRAEVLAPALFSFAEPDTARVLVNVVRFRENAAPTDTASVAPGTEATVYTLTRNRRYLRDTTLEVLGRRRDAQVWEVRELIERDENGVLALRTTSREVYAEDLGLAYRARRLPDGSVEAYRLAETFPMEELVRRAEASQR